MKQEKNFVFGTFKNNQKFLCHSVRSLLASSDVTNQWVIHEPKYHKANHQSMRSELLKALLKFKVF